MSEIFVIYHKTDADGFGACWSAWLKFKNKATYLGFDYLNDFPLDFFNKTIYFLDVSLNPEKVKILKKNNNKIILIDHHLSSLKLKNLVDEFIFDIKHSAAILTFKYFFRNKKVPKLLKYIEDQDLWRFKLSHSREINIVIDLLENNFEKWYKFIKDLEKPLKFKELIKKGKQMLEYQQYLIKDIVSKAVLVEFEKYKVKAVNSSVLISEVGNELVKKYPPFALIWSVKGKKKTISLRSDGTVDVSKIAEKYGGGGHRGAASFLLPLKADWPWKIIQ
ncbi:MAG: DHH family phosphoesterase [Minisyncoccia bacterium]